jgi:hypothetical protein
LVYGQRNDALQVVLNWKAVSCFLLKNHFKVIEGDQIGESNQKRAISNTPDDPHFDAVSSGGLVSRHSQLSYEAGPLAIFYYPITSIVRRKDQQRSTKGLFGEVMRAFCRNLFSHCSREGRARYKKELE